MLAFCARRFSVFRHLVQNTHTHTHIVYEHVMNRKKYREIVYDAELCNQRNIERDIHRPNVYFIRPVRVETVRSRNKCMDKTQ